MPEMAASVHRAQIMYRPWERARLRNRRDFGIVSAMHLARTLAREARRAGRLAGRLLPWAVLLGLLILRAWDPAPVELLRLQVFDQLQRAAPRQRDRPLVLIVDIDDRSLAELGQWPWPRTMVAAMVDRLAAAGAQVIAFDVVFAEPDRLSPKSLLDALPDLRPELRQALSTGLPDNDAVLAQSIAAAPVVLATAPSVQARRDAAPTGLPGGVAEVGGDPRPFLLRYRGLVPSLPVLAAEATGIGHVGVAPELDNVARRVPLLIDVNGSLVPSLTLETLRVLAQARTSLVRSDEAGVVRVGVRDLSVETDRNGLAWVRYARPLAGRYIAARDLLAGRVAPQRLAGRVVLIGTSAAALADIKPTPLGMLMPGVEVHAQLLETVLDRATLVAPNYALGAELVLTFATGALLIGIMPWLGALPTLLLGGVVAAALALGSWYLFLARSVLIDVSFAAACGLVVYGLLVCAKYLREEGARKSIRLAFAQYLSSDLVDRLVRHPDRLRLGGEMRVATVMFVDVRGFTKISESLDAEALTALINRILTRITGEVLRYRGTIDKYIGDAAMAFWNAPLDDPEHAPHACAAALAVVEGIAALDAELRAEGRTDEDATTIRVGIGLNTGLCCVGNIGSTQRFNYSVIGDPVNIAARLEEQTKLFGCPILVGEDTARAASGFALLELDELRVRGKALTTRVLALLGNERLAASAEFRALADCHRMMLEAVRQGSEEEARELLARCRELQGDLPLTQAYDLYEARLAARFPAFRAAAGSG
jgi:adenylate cyclase